MSSPSNKIDQNEVNVIQDSLQCSISSVYRQQKSFYKMWTFDRSNQKYSSEMVYQTMHCYNKKKVSKALRKEIVDWILKKSNVCQSPITRDTLLISDADSKLKRSVPKLLL